MTKLRECFSDMNVNTGRQDELDIVKGLAIIFMVWCHVYREIGADTSTFAGVMVDSILGGPFAAPMFMICMGVGICYSRSREPKQFFERGIKLLILGYVLNVFRFVIPKLVVCIALGKSLIWKDMLCELMEVDILQFAGMAFLLIGAAVKFKISKRILFGIAAGMSILGVLLKDVATGSCFLDLVLGLFWKTQGHAYFTLFHWFIFPVFGMIFGEWLLRCKDKATAYKRLIPITIPICIVTEGGAILLGISLLDSFTDYFYMTIIDVIFLFALFILWTGILHLLHMQFKNIRITLLQRMSRDINSIFCIHWVIIGIVCAVKEIILPSSTPGFFTATFTATAILIVSVMISGKVRWKI